MLLHGSTAGEPVYRPPDAYPLPTGLPGQANVRYWFAADRDVYTDVAGTLLPSDGDAVACWKNQGSNGQNAVQNTSARRPIFHTGGQNGRAYIESDATIQQYFEDLTLYDIAGGITTWSGWQTVMAVWSDNNPTNGKIKGIIGDEASTKGLLYIQTTGGMRFGKNQWLTPAFNDTNCHAIIWGTDGTCGAHYMLENGVDVNAGSCTNASSTAMNDAQFLRATIAGAGNGYWDGRLYELIVHNGSGEMSTANRTPWMNYLKTKYAL